MTGVTQQAPRTAVELPAPPLDPRGRRMWRELTAGGELGAAQRVLVEEACRIADRLDKLDAQLRGRDAEWLHLELDDTGTTAVVVVDKALAEARQQAVALKTVFAELRQTQAPVKPDAPKATEVSTGVSDLTARIAARRAAPKG